MAKKTSGMRIFLIILGLVVLIGIAGVIVYMNKGDEVIEVKTEKVSRKTITQLVSAIGKIQPETEVKISSESSGELIQLNVKDGDFVKAGQVLAKIKPDIIETQLEELRASLDAAKTDIDFNKSAIERAENDLKRKSDLFKKEFLSKQEFENAKTTYDQAVASYQASLARFQQAQASLKRVQKSADRTTIYSPIDGVVTKLLVEKGEKVLGTAQFQGTELMRISDLTVMNAVVDIDENDIVNVKIGDTTRVEVDAFPNKKFNGIVYEISHSAKQSATGTQDQVTNFEVKVRMIDRDDKFRPGMSCNVDIETETRANVIAVPLQAVTMRTPEVEEKKDDEGGVRAAEKEVVKKKVKSQTVVFVKKGSIVRQTNVETGISGDGHIEIKSGLNESDEIVSGSFSAVSKLLQDSSKVKLEVPKAKVKIKLGSK